MSDQDPHAPTTAGPEPVVASVPDEPTPLPPPAGDWSSPAGAAWPVDPEERPEVLVGAAFAGGLLAAIVLKRITRGGR